MKEGVLGTYCAATEGEGERESSVWDSAQFPGWDLGKNTQGGLNIVLSAHLAGDQICMSWSAPLGTTSH